MKTKTQIAVLDRGFVYVGQCSLADGLLTITGAKNVRRWGTENGLGQLAMSGPTAKSKIDPAGTVTAPIGSVVHLIDCSPEAWPVAETATAA